MEGEELRRNNLYYCTVLKIHNPQALLSMNKQNRRSKVNDEKYYKRHHKRVKDIYHILEHAIIVPAGKRHDRFCPDIMAL